MIETITKYITSELIQKADEVISPQDDLLGSGLLDSMDLMRMIAYIEEEFKIKIPASDMIIENFMNVEFICKYIKSMLDSKQ